jgi:plastocyanin
MLQRSRLLIGGGLGLLAVAVTISVYATGESLGRSAITGGGGWLTNSSGALRGAVAQPLAGVVSNGTQTLCSGFECNAAAAAQPATQTPTPSMTATASGTEPTATATGSQTPAPTTTPQTSLVAVANNFFDPNPIIINVGDTVAWQRTVGFHNVRADDESFRLGENPAGDPGDSWSSVSQTFTQAGTFRYYCEIHGGPGGDGMAGTVIVQAISSTPTPTTTATPTTSPAPTISPTPTGTRMPGSAGHQLFLPVIQG